MMKSAKLEWCLGELKNAIRLLDEGLAKYSKFDKLWMMKGTIFLQMNGRNFISFHLKEISNFCFRCSFSKKSFCEGN